MELHQLLNMLQGVSGPNASGEYTAKCPAHQDRTASLTACAKASPKDGKEKIYLCCHAGCTGSDIMAALGISAKDLIVNPDPDRPAAGGKGNGGDGSRGSAGSFGNGARNDGAHGTGRRKGRRCRRAGAGLGAPGPGVQLHG